MEIITIICTTFGSLLGWEGIKWLMTRKSNTRIASAQADVAEVKAESDEFHHLRELSTSLQQQLREDAAMYREQTQLVRQLQKDLLEAEKKVARLETERSMKLCEVRNCCNRQPQSGY